MKELSGHIENLLCRFGNKALGDTVKRVGNDLKRKLAPNDRIIGAYNICLETGVPAHFLCLAVSAAVNFKGDELSGRDFEDILNEAGSLDLIRANDLLLVKKYDGIIKGGAAMRELLETVKNDEQ
jgi:mannitol-1-phosphate/altronate dehydrogenase